MDNENSEDKQNPQHKPIPETSPRRSLSPRRTHSPDDRNTPDDDDPSRKGKQVVPPPREDPSPPRPFSIPSEARFLARFPTHQAENPHRKLKLFDQIVTNTGDLFLSTPRVTFQKNLGSFDTIVIDGKNAFANVPQDFIDNMKKNPAEFALIIPFLGGPHLFAIYGDENPVSDISNVIYDAGLAAEDSLEILPIAPDKERIHTYMALLNAPAYTVERLCEIGLFPHDADLLAAGGGNPKNGNRFRWALAELIMTNSDIARAFERATGGLNAPPRHSKHWCAYAKPCTDEYEGWEAVRAAIRKHRLKHAASMVVFEPVAGGRDAPWCQNCKGDDHLHWGCPPVKDGDNDDCSNRSSGAPVTSAARTTNTSKKAGGSGSSSNRNAGRNNSQRGGRR
ncbi:hypothetical protein R3P38DRAFT_3321575 [Favolaschia claudopus]|uniref:Uncharacterized protein n=1 Tax=Favolaschia claudopus TaxID=2862362 RepID=A0AAV9Z1L5_9AGAR